MLVLLDGKASVAQVRTGAASLPPAAVDQALERLLKAGLIVPAIDVTSDQIEPGDFFAGAASESEAAAAKLKHHGYFVKFARHAAEARKLADGQKLTVLVVEDDPQLAKLVRTYFQMEGIDTRLAANREEINAGLRQAPKPDVMLLDVMLPDIMMTARATREAVLKGLARGADGYVTKPFEVDVLLKAVKTVAGLK